VGTGSAPDANTIPIGKDNADEAFDYAACIGCGACVAACPNASAMLFVGSKVAHLALLPQGSVERRARIRNMVQAMDAEGFGGCTNHGECSAYCPKKISFDAIALLNREYWKAGIARNQVLAVRKDERGLHAPGDCSLRYRPSAGRSELRHGPWINRLFANCIELNSAHIAQKVSIV